MLSDAGATMQCRSQVSTGSYSLPQPAPGSLRHSSQEEDPSVRSYLSVLKERRAVQESATRRRQSWISDFAMNLDLPSVPEEASTNLFLEGTTINRSWLDTHEISRTSSRSSLERQPNRDSQIVSSRLKSLISSLNQKLFSREPRSEDNTIVSRDAVTVDASAPDVYSKPLPPLPFERLRPSSAIRTNLRPPPVSMPFQSTPQARALSYLNPKLDPFPGIMLLKEQQRSKANRTLIPGQNVVSSPSGERAKEIHSRRNSYGSQPFTEQRQSWASSGYGTTVLPSIPSQDDTLFERDLPDVPWETIPGVMSQGIKIITPSDLLQHEPSRTALTPSQEIARAWRVSWGMHDELNFELQDFEFEGENGDLFVAEPLPLGSPIPRHPRTLLDVDHIIEWLTDIQSDPMKRTHLIGSEEQSAVEICGLLQNILDDGHKRLLPWRGFVLKLLQDLSCEAGQLPNEYWLSDVQVIRKRPINCGGEAVVYMGLWKGSEVAVREMYAPRDGDWNSPSGLVILKDIRREIITHRQLSHRNILPLLGIFCEEGETAPIIVLPYTRRGLAITFLRSTENARPEAFLKTIIGTCSALAYLHTQDPPVIHGDIHPSNLLLDDDDEPILCDFGLSRVRYDVTRTRTNIRSGGRTRYVAPEILVGPDVLRTTEATDMYSLGMTIFELATLEVPFADILNDFLVANRVQSGARPPKPESLGRLGDEGTEYVWRLIEDMWCQKPELRSTAACAQERLLNAFSL